MRRERPWPEERRRPSRCRAEENGGGSSEVQGEPSLAAARGRCEEMAAGLAGGEGEEEGEERERRPGGWREARSWGWPGKEVPVGRELGLGREGCDWGEREIERGRG